jgi:DNA-binding PadR family transcriptional regulator
LWRPHDGDGRELYELTTTAWETDPPSGRPARHLYRLTGEGARFADELRTAVAAEIPHASGSGGVIRPALGEAF